MQHRYVERNVERRVLGAGSREAGGKQSVCHYTEVCLMEPIIEADFTGELEQLSENLGQWGSFEKQETTLHCSAVLKNAIMVKHSIEMTYSLE